MRFTELDHHSPIPLYHQLAEALRYQIATGALRVGAPLPPLRKAAGLWAVNLHTVRRAYAELVAQGIAVTRGPAGTRVLSGLGGHGASPSGRRRERFLARVLREARERHGIDAAELAALLQAKRAIRPVSPSTAYVIECSRSQCEDLAAQLEARWRVSAIPWPLDRDDLPPAGLLLATYFHYNDVRVRLAGRLSDVRFAAISPDPGLRARLRRTRRGATRQNHRTTQKHPRTSQKQRQTRVYICERDSSMARNIAADLRRILPEGEFEILTQITARPEQWLQRKKPRIPVLFAPRMWGTLSEKARAHPRVHEVSYVFDPHDLETIGHELGWQPR